MDVIFASNNFVFNGVKRVYKFFSTIPKSVDADNFWFYNISNLAYILIAILHSLWIIVFYCTGQRTMMYTQLVSISCYVMALFFNRKGYHVLAMVIGITEANLHQVLAVTLLGWNTGFQNFIPLIALLPFLKYNESWFTKLSLISSCLVCYLYIDKFVKNIPPLFHLDPVSASFLAISNSVLCFLLVALWGIVLSISYQRAVSALIKKEQELFASQKANEQAEILRQLELKERDNEISNLRNIELRNRNIEIVEKTRVIEQLVTEQEHTIQMRTMQLEETNIKLIEANKKLIELIQYSSHSLREPVTRLMGTMGLRDDMSQEDFYKDIWPEMERAVQDLDKRIRDVVKIAEETIRLNS